MTLGEIKLESLRLMNTNDEALSVVNLAIYQEDDRYKDYLDRMVGSINRAISRFITMKILPTKTKQVVISQGKTVKDFLKYELKNLISDYGSLESIIHISDYVIPVTNFQRLGDAEILIPYYSEYNYKGVASEFPSNPKEFDCYNVSGVAKYFNGTAWEEIDNEDSFTFVYNPVISAFTVNSDNNIEIDIPEVLARAIPYFVKGELYEQDEPNIAATSRNIFENIITEYVSYGSDKKTHQSYVKNVMF